MKSNKPYIKSNLAADLIEKVPSLTLREATVIINALTASITGAIADGRPVVLRGFGMFKTTFRRAHIGRIVSTGAPISVPDHHLVKFIPSKHLNNIINK